jgi:hypothetical protein
VNRGGENKTFPSKGFEGGVHPVHPVHLKKVNIWIFAEKTFFFETVTNIDVLSKVRMSRLANGNEVSNGRI